MVNKQSKLISPGLPCPGAIHDPTQGKWMAILLNPVKYMADRHGHCLVELVLVFDYT